MNINDINAKGIDPVYHHKPSIQVSSIKEAETIIESLIASITTVQADIVIAKENGKLLDLDDILAYIDDTLFELGL